MSRTKRNGAGNGGFANPKSITQFKRGTQITIHVTNERGIEKVERNDCSDRNHLLKKYLSRKRRHGYDKQAKFLISNEF